MGESKNNGTTTTTITTDVKNTMSVSLRMVKVPFLEREKAKAEAPKDVTEKYWAVFDAARM